jgi:hypothetical protein
LSPPQESRHNDAESSPIPISRKTTTAKTTAKMTNKTTNKTTAAKSTTAKTTTTKTTTTKTTTTKTTTTKTTTTKTTAKKMPDGFEKIKKPIKSTNKHGREETGDSDSDSDEDDEDEMLAGGSRGRKSAKLKETKLQKSLRFGVEQELELQKEKDNLRH